LLWPLEKATESGSPGIEAEWEYCGFVATYESRAAELAAEFVALPRAAHYAEPEGVAVHCKEAATAFCVFAYAMGADPVALRLAYPRTLDFSGIHPSWPDGLAPYAVNYVIVIEDAIVDLTARKFDPAAPFPLVEPVAACLARWIEVSVVPLCARREEIGLDTPALPGEPQLPPEPTERPAPV
jgi:hypothetical protein